jgi:hypothetical protein
MSRVGDLLAEEIRIGNCLARGALGHREVQKLETALRAISASISRLDV